MIAMNYAIISIGSNINPKENNLKALKILREEQEILAESEFVVTKPVGFQDQPDFLNGCVLIQTSLDFDDLNEFLKEMERRLHSVKTQEKSGPRTIDLDIVSWNKEFVYQDEELLKADFLKNSVKEIIPSLEKVLGKVEWENNL